MNVPDKHWIYDRGFTKQTILDWDCKTNNYLDFMIPAKNENSEIVGWITRRTQAIPKYLFSKGFSKSKILFGMHKVNKIDTLYIVEGFRLYVVIPIWISSSSYFRCYYI